MMFKINTKKIYIYNKLSMCIRVNDTCLLPTHMDPSNINVNI